MKSAIAAALGRVTKTLYEEEERRRKDAAKQERMSRSYERYYPREITLKEAVFSVMREAVKTATGEGALPVGARSLYYAVRPLVQKFTDKDLDYNYFSQELLTQYREYHGEIQGLYYDPRGVLYEPHTGKEVPLGTREVDAYTFPVWTYNKILYVEKKGLWPVIKAARLAERYDMAVIAAEGYATEAARTLFNEAEKGQQYQLFVLHDADPYGYNIARTLREETRRMRDYSVDVIDLGLTIADAVTMGLEAEAFTRKKRLPYELVLSDIEKDYFEGRLAGRMNWICRRVELNALTGPDLIAYIERKLKAADVTGKVIPDEAALPDEVEKMEEEIVGSWADALLSEILNLDDIKSQLVDAFREIRELDARTTIEEKLAEKPVLDWRSALRSKLEDLTNEHKLKMEEILRNEVASAVEGGAA